MRLTPAEVHNVAFKKPSIGKRGYDEDEVDAFLDLVEDELARLIEENNELTARVGGTSSATPTAPSDAPVAAGSDDVVASDAVAEPAVESAAPAAGVAPVASGDAHVHAARLLGLAQETADRLTAEAKAESDQLLADAKAESERVRTEAQTYSDDLLTEAHAKAESAEQDAQRTSDEVLSGLAEERVGLEKKIDDLRTYEREYRSRLKTWINDQLEALDGNNSESTTVS